MEVVRQQLTEAGVIGGIVDDFDPQFQLYVIYPDIPISLGDQVLPAQVQRRPRQFLHLYDTPYPEFREAFRNPTRTALVMTDLDPDGGEYLHWLGQHFMSSEPVTQFQDLVSYEAPSARHMGTRKIVFTLFELNDSHRIIVIPASRNNFNTRNFANMNQLGAPLSAAFFRIINPIEKDYKKLLASLNWLHLF